VSRSLVALLALPLALLCAWPARAAPFVPADDSQVLATVPARATDPRARELLALRQAWQRTPQNLGTAVAYARRCFDAVAAEGDPRFVGHAQAALAPWFNLPDPPAAVRVLRAQILQFDHQFTPALADLDAVLRQQPDNGDAWAWRTAILMVQADYAAARRSCDGLAAQATPLIGAACRAQVDAATGQATAAASALRTALAQQPDASAEARLWALTRLAETEERRGAFPAAEAAFRSALALGLPDVYLQAAYADFLLDRGRPAEVLALLKDRGRADVLLLRLALAARAAGDASAAGACPGAGRALCRRRPARRCQPPQGRGALRPGRAGRRRPCAAAGAAELRGAEGAGRCPHPAGGGAGRTPAGRRPAGAGLDGRLGHRERGAAAAGGRIEGPAMSRRAAWRWLVTMWLLLAAGGRWPTSRPTAT
jgi:tetratricopeptide (TPR) repeat protein